jgi:predicted  nucleic acid-binding Zn-ribbon protein
LNKLEGRAGFSHGAGDPDDPDAGREADAARALDNEIANLRREIAAAEARMSPDELAASRAEWAAESAALEERMHGLTLEEQIAVLEAEIEEAEAEGGEGVR